MDKLYIIRYHHVRWDGDECEHMTYTDYSKAREAYDELRTHDYYDVVELYNCVQVIGYKRVETRNELS